MSVSTVSSVSSIATSVHGRPAYQPFQCLVCHCRFTRHENLKRHAALHSRSPEEASLPCDFCHATFSRRDLRHRHMKRKHPEHQRRDKQASRSPTESQDGLHLQHAGDHGDLDMDSGIWTDLDSNLLLGASFLDPVSQSASLNPNLASINFDQGITDSLLSIDLPQIQDDWFPSSSQVSQGCHLFFTHVSHFVPFLHRPTFDATQVPNHLLLSMLCLGYQYGEDPNCGHQAGSGVSLSLRCFHRARVLIAPDEERAEDSTYNATMVQAYLLIQIYAMMYLCGDESAYGLKTHSRMISLARAGGLMLPISIESVATQDLDSLWRHFIKAESHKRTLFAVHQIDALWYQFLSIPRSLSHLEIKHDLPCPEDYWTASSSVEWAHRRLVARQSGSSVQYPEAVRRFLSSDADLSSIPAFDPYGAINIAQFLVSSAREVSGWSTMTGMLSMERLEPLRSSLLALSPFIRPQSEAANATHEALCEATWETAMIEMQMWSPTHTGGIVEGSMDAVLHQLTYLAPSCEFLCESNTAEAIQPHVDWFLRYLDTTVVPDSEAPWITLYAYKAFMVAWQLVRGGVLGSMQVVGVHDGDVEGALMWARKVFQRRERWQLGKIIMVCLDTLEK
ncbi:hypothetical protein K505DRAFT_259531 [Melanomma pulvis-pyrius CBS 109.77]|uniref:C2H2-type domain-containing protein n=1 Tax=Melanomma pulvis-pyrius CBS 109.77 TaxID=1314802 RepID=A0A6A6WR98_9PLEO|nr:hypothetical protein K505DRAFT_259531 [Melanomma pulvis-pyrius CBS 109.77]